MGAPSLPELEVAIADGGIELDSLSTVLRVLTSIGRILKLAIFQLQPAAPPLRTLHMIASEVLDTLPLLREGMCPVTREDEGFEMFYTSLAMKVVARISKG